MFNNRFISYFTFNQTSGISDAPATISGLTAWFDASSTSYVTISGSNSVTTWIDRANGYNVSNTGSFMPTYTTSSVNGKNTITFDGSTQFLKNETNAQLYGILSGSSDNITIFSVLKPTISPTVRDVAVAVGQYGNLTGETTIGIWDENAFHFDLDRGLDTSNPSRNFYSYTQSEWHILTCETFKTEANVRISVNGNNFVTGSTESSSTSPNRFAIGARAYAETKQFHGEMAEIIIYNRSLTDTEVATVEDYLFNKYFNPYNFTGLTAWYQAASASSVQTEII